MAQEQSKGFYLDNVVEIEINGKKYEVNKYEAEALKNKLAKNKKK